MSPEQRKTRALLHLMLQQVKTEALKFSNGKQARRWFNNKCGVCENLANKLEHAGAEKEASCEVWRLFSQLNTQYAQRPSGGWRASIICPIDGIESYMSDYHNDTMWENPARFKYLDWLIEQTKSE